MKRTLQLALIAIISLFQFQTVIAQLTTKELGTPLYNGQGNPKTSKFVQLNTIVDSVTYTQQAEGMNIVTKSAQWIPVTWYATADSGFVANGAYTVEAKVAIHKSMKNGFFLEMQGAPGKRFKIDIDTTAVYNMTYSPSTAKEVIANNLDNRGMHTYRVAVDNNDLAHIYRDGVKIGTADVDGLVSSSAYYKDILNPETGKVVMDDQFFEDFKDLATAPHVANNATLSTNLSGNYDITQSSWCKMGIDTTKANVKVGLTSLWFQNGTTGALNIRKNALVAGKYKFSFWAKSKDTYMKYKGSIKYVGTDPNRPAVKFKGTQIDSIPAYVGTDPDVVLFPYGEMVNGNKNFTYREFAFDLHKDGDIMITFWNNGAGIWANMWFDDIRIAKVEPLPFLRFGKDSEAGVTNFTFGSLTYDMTGAYAPAPSGINNNKMAVNEIVATNKNGQLLVNYTLLSGSKTEIQLLDLSGRILSQQNVLSIVGKNSTTINTSGLQGVYLLRVISNDAAKTVKVEVK